MSITKANTAKDKEDQINVELPARVLENMDTHLDQLSGALTARDLTFPCVRKTVWGDQLIVRIIKKNTPVHKTI